MIVRLVITRLGLNSAMNEGEENLCYRILGI
jgi:hypothetical protein